MYTSVTCLALVCSLAAGGAEPNWRTSYRDGQKQAQQQGRPLAIFVSGKDHAPLPADVRAVLAREYVCVRLDPADAGAKALIGSLAITRGAGLVISDRGANVQAFHHDGTLTPDELLRTVNRFAAPDLVVTQTHSLDVPVARFSHYPSEAQFAPSTYVPQFAPQAYVPQTFVRAPANC